MTPVLIEATMDEPVVFYNDGLHIDGPLAFAKFSSLPRSAREMVPSISGEWAVDFPLPLDKWFSPVDPRDFLDDRLLEDGQIWGWKASAAIPCGEFVSGHHALRKRPALNNMSRYSSDRRYNGGSGSMRAKNLKYPTMFTRKIRWYAYGDAESINRLLSDHVHAIGKLSNQGPGKVSRWFIDEVEVDKSMFDGEKLMRRLPVGIAGKNIDMATYGSIRPPYHHRSRQCFSVECDHWMNQ